MALEDEVTNTYTPAVKLSSRCARVIKRGTVLTDQLSPATFEARSVAGETHIDLWIDDGLYPVNPATNSPLSFQTTKEYLEFLCHCEQCMLGYIRRVSGIEAILNLESTIQLGLEHEYEVQRGVGEHLSNTSTALVHERVHLQIKVANLEATCEALRMSVVGA